MQRAGKVAAVLLLPLETRLLDTHRKSHPTAVKAALTGLCAQRFFPGMNFVYQCFGALYKLWSQRTRNADSQRTRELRARRAGGKPGGKQALKPGNPLGRRRTAGETLPKPPLGRRGRLSPGLPPVYSGITRALGTADRSPGTRARFAGVFERRRAGAGIRPR